MTVKRNQKNPREKPAIVVMEKEVTLGTDGMRIYAWLDEAWKTQTFSDNKSSMVHYEMGGGYWNAGGGTVGVRKPSKDNPTSLIYQELGSASVVPDDYASAGYRTVANLVAGGALNQTLNANYRTDNGYLAPHTAWT